MPETSVKVTLLNFMITPKGLADQLIGIVMQSEQPEKQQLKEELVIQGVENKNKLTAIENDILKVLSESKGNILDDEAAINVLSDAKVLGNEIAEKQQVAEKIEFEVDELIVKYYPCSETTSVLYFCIAELANIDPM